MKNDASRRFNNILIRVPNWLGDSMMATPTVSAVRRMFPKARLSILGKSVFTDFWKSFPGVDEFIVYEKGFRGFWNNVSRLKQKRFDAALILPNSFSSAFSAFAAEIPVRAGWGGEGRDLFLTQVVPRPNPRQRHLVLEYLDLARRGFAVPLPSEKTAKLQCAVTKDAERELRRVWGDNGVSGKAFIALAPGATYGEAKRWPLPYWKELIQKLLEGRKESLLILGGMEEEAYLKPLLEAGKGSGRLHLLAGRTSPVILAAMLARCKILITNDTGPMHVAAAAGTPTVALFGSTSPTWTRPFGMGHEVIYHQVECSPCFQRTCPIGYICLNKISVEEVFQAAQKQLKRPHKIQAEKLPKNF